VLAKTKLNVRIVNSQARVIAVGNQQAPAIEVRGGDNRLGFLIAAPARETQGVAVEDPVVGTGSETAMFLRGQVPRTAVLSADHLAE
jgi:hypothetical protein